MPLLGQGKIVEYAGEIGTVKDIAAKLKIDPQKIYQQLNREKRGIKAKVKKQTIIRSEKKPIVVDELKIYFRPSMYNGTTPILFDAVMSDNEGKETILMHSINKTVGDKWQWNCYNIGKFDSRLELVSKYLSMTDQDIENCM